MVFLCRNHLVQVLSSSVTELSYDWNFVKEENERLGRRPAGEEVMAKVMAKAMAKNNRFVRALKDKMGQTEGVITGVQGLGSSNGTGSPEHEEGLTRQTNTGGKSPCSGRGSAGRENPSSLLTGTTGYLDVRP